MYPLKNWTRNSRGRLSTTSWVGLGKKLSGSIERLEPSRRVCSRLMSSKPHDHSYHLPSVIDLCPKLPVLSGQLDLCPIGFVWLPSQQQHQHDSTCLVFLKSSFCSHPNPFICGTSQGQNHLLNRHWPALTRTVCGSLAGEVAAVRLVDQRKSVSPWSINPSAVQVKPVASFRNVSRKRPYKVFLSFSLLSLHVISCPLCHLTISFLALISCLFVPYYVVAFSIHVDFLYFLACPFMFLLFLVYR